MVVPSKGGESLLREEMGALESIVVSTLLAILHC